MGRNAIQAWGNTFGTLGAAWDSLAMSAGPTAGSKEYLVTAMWTHIGRRFAALRLLLELTVHDRTVFYTPLFAIHIVLLVKPVNAVLGKISFGHRAACGLRS